MVYFERFQDYRKAAIAAGGTCIFAGTALIAGGVIPTPFATGGLVSTILMIGLLP